MNMRSIMYDLVNIWFVKNMIWYELKKIEDLLREIKDSLTQTPIIHITAGTRIKTHKNKRRTNGKTRKITDRRKIFIRKPKKGIFKKLLYLK